MSGVLDIDLLDPEYAMPGELERSAQAGRPQRVEAWPERAQRRIEALEARMAALEGALGFDRPPRRLDLFAPPIVPLGATEPQEAPAVRISQLPNGRTCCANVTLRYSRPLSEIEAIERARAGKTVFVRAQDAQAVLAALQEEERA
jgi:hypothetical protein